MKADYERDYAAAEGRHPWFVARRELFASFARGLERAPLLDFGCGTGIFLAHLRARGFTDLTGVEPSAELRARFRDPAIPVAATLGDAPARRFAGIFALDVLEHLADDAAALRDLRARLAPGGRLFVSVPAHPFLWSRHDELNLHHRRYRKAELRRALDGAGFRVRRLTWWNMVAFPPIALRRWLSRGAGASELAGAAAVAHGSRGASDRDHERRGIAASPMMRVALAMLRAENALVKRVALPFGVSLIAIAEAP